MSRVADPRPSHSSNEMTTHQSSPGISQSLQMRLGDREFRRRLWHITPGFLPFILWAIPHKDPISVTLKVVVLVVATVLSVRIFVQYRLIRRTKDESRAGAVLGYSLSVLGTMLAFPAHSELAFTVLAILAFGDGSATLGGLLIGGRSLPWNSRKTISGTLCFMFFGSLMGAIIYWGEANPIVPFSGALQIAALASVIAAIAESLPTRLDDNIRVGICGSLGVAAGQFLVFGF
jgi:phytol kinase